MARQEWCWSFVLKRAPSGTYTLSAKQDLIDPDKGGKPLKMKPRHGLKGGGDIWEQLSEMLDEISVDIGEIDQDEIADLIAQFDPKAADEFRRGESIVEEKQEQEANRRAHLRSVKIAPFFAIIEAYCERLSDVRTRGGGGVSRPSERVRVRAFLEEYVFEHGKLPTGKQSWHLGSGYLSGEHDFSDLKPS